MRITVAIAFAKLEAFLDRAIADLNPADAGPLQDSMLEASDAYMDSMRQRFVEESQGGGEWQPHAESTERRRGKGAPILIEEGDLQRSLERGQPGHILEVASDGVREGTNDRTAGWQHNGTPTIPARPILVAPDSQTLDLMEEVLAKGVKAQLESLI